jgi:cytoskeleton protein RodZ
MVVAVMLVCSLVYAWWQRRPVHTAAAPEYNPAVAQTTIQTPPPAQTPAPVQTPPPQPATPPAGTAAETSVPATVPPAPAPPRPAPMDTVSHPAPTPAPATPVPAPAAAVPKAAPNPNATVHVELTAEEATWVLVRTDGKYLFSGTLQANETRSVEATGTVLVRLGNAGGVGITLNGKPLGAVGPKGQVRTVQLSAAGFQVVPATPAAPKTAPAPDPL